MKNVLFVCVESSCRSQMAEAFFNSMAGGGAESAGISPAEEVDKGAIEVMKEIGIDISGKKPKVLMPEMNEKFDFIVTMGCIDGCPVTPREKTIEWNIEDPKGKSIEEYRKARDVIKQKVKKLIGGMGND
ncbi:MAG: arsenate reductase ArsC [Thermoplasmata archaeon]|nr:arsenate reductase ArsC [Thermoplasmata archaeon]